MVIKVLGTGCSKCKALYAAVEKVVKENGINAELIKEEDLEKIMSYHVMALPALVVDEKVVAKGVISEAEIKKALMPAK
ncbi:MAG: thioredoxin family protein [Bacteroidales bacterium]|jgi:small redox-active disulfide protein 2|nr:thioredoxin family protein [Bacteroidales bacterium]